MWENWKRKIKNMFTYEVEEEIIEEIPIMEKQPEAKPPKPKQVRKLSEQQDLGRSNVQRESSTVRMTYQYPQNSKYSIPSEIERKKTARRIPESNEPVYKVNRPIRKRENVRQTPAPIIRKERERSRRDVRSPVQTSHNEPRQKKLLEKKRPFQPTEVPSPIYGFQPRRQKREIEQSTLPFQDRQEKQIEIEPNQIPVLAQAKPVLEQPPAYDEIAAATDIPEIMEEMPKQKRNPIHSTEKAPVESFTFEQTDHQQAIVQPVVQKQAVVTAPTPPAELDKVTDTVQTAYIQQQEADQGEMAKPYNVVMTDADKLHVAHKAYQRKQEIQQQFQQVVSGKQETSLSELTHEQREPVPFHLLNDPAPANHEDSLWVEEQKELLEKTLGHFNVKAHVVNATQGPSVTKFEVQPELGVKVSKVKNLSDDLKLNMAAKDIRIEAPIPGKNTIGIEVPNPHAQTVELQGILESDAFQNSSSPLTIGLGLSIEGTPVVTNIQKMPHGLIAGATGSGKSVCINTILLSLLYKASHEEVRFLLIDPKMVELAPYNGIPHLVSPVITDVKAATAALKWAVAEMEDRYERFVKEGVRDISRYNEKMVKQGRHAEKMAYLVIVIDELADLMMVSPQDVEDAICRIAQKARACGMHLLLATQRPSVDVITGLIKANIPTRIAFSVSSQIDSRTIIDTSGAERLLGKGDMLFVENGAGNTIRIQGAFVSDDEIERVANYARSIAPTNYLFEQEELLAKVQVDEAADELLEEAIDFVIEQNHASTSLLQRHFRIGYNRAARLIDTLEKRGIINQQNGSKPRDVLVSRAQLEEMTK